MSVLSYLEITQYAEREIRRHIAAAGVFAMWEALALHLNAYNLDVFSDDAVRLDTLINPHDYAPAA
ncbi:hypothetical protein WJ63_10415 [Burkholderia pyrrocinia]|nr:hypothetical protein WJ63_10415 [Burkholderia pyrrocinia]